MSLRTALSLFVLLSIGCTAGVAPSDLQSYDPAAEPRQSFSASGKADGSSVSREDWVLDEIADWNAGLSDADQQRKYGLMAESPFRFFRGTNHLYWADFANDRRLSEYGSDDTVTWVQGDLHGSNYGAFTDDGGEVVYDLNDFDESILADYQLDIWRMATSIILVARQNGLSDADAEEAVDAFAESYLDRIADVRGNGGELDAEWDLDDAYGRLDELLEEVIDEEGRDRLLSRWTTVTPEGRRFDASLEDIGAIDDDLRDELVATIPSYGDTLTGGIDYAVDYFAVLDVARRLNAGTGSSGTPRYYVLIEGPTSDEDDDVILDVKRQRAPTGYAYLSASARDRYDAWFVNHAERSAIGQRALLTDVDDYLGWMTFAGDAYSVRERTPHREGFPLEELDTDTRLRKLAEQWGTILATDHARADRDFSEEYVPTSFDREVDELTDGDHAGFRALTYEVANGYADQVLADHAAFVAWISD